MSLLARELNCQKASFWLHPRHERQFKGSGAGIEFEVERLTPEQPDAMYSHLPRSNPYGFFYLQAIEYRFITTPSSIMTWHQNNFELPSFFMLDSVPCVAACLGS